MSTEKKKKQKKKSALNGDCQWFHSPKQNNFIKGRTKDLHFIKGTKDSIHIYGTCTFIGPTTNVWTFEHLGIPSSKSLENQHRTQTIGDLEEDFPFQLGEFWAPCWFSGV